MDGILIALLITLNACALVGFALGYKTGYSCAVDDMRAATKKDDRHE